jgi:hypothetical protein
MLANNCAPCPLGNLPALSFRRNLAKFKRSIPCFGAPRQRQRKESLAEVLDLACIPVIAHRAPPMEGT